MVYGYQLDEGNKSPIDISPELLFSSLLDQLNRKQRSSFEKQKSLPMKC